MAIYQDFNEIILRPGKEIERRAVETILAVFSALIGNRDADVLSLHLFCKPGTLLYKLKKWFQ